jgi:hypothetical protein
VNTSDFDIAFMPSSVNQRPTLKLHR